MNKQWLKLAIIGIVLTMAPNAQAQAKAKDFEAGMAALLVPYLKIHAVFIEDKGDGAAESNQLNSDCDRIIVRAGYDVSEKARVSLGYRHQEFEEKRWDDYAMDIYSMSISGKF